MGGSCEFVSQVAQVILDLAEGFILRKIDEPFCHLSQDPLAVGTEMLQKSVNADLAVFGGL
jgi:hypothetical protein